MGGGNEQLLGCSTVTHIAAYAEGHEAPGRFRLLRWVEYRRTDHDVSPVPLIDFDFD